MMRGSLLDSLGYLRRLARLEQAAATGDAALVQRFVAQQDQAAFEALILRHGPLVWDVCRHVLGDVHAAEDAFQATFLVLAKRAGAIRKQAALASWLYGVAYKVAARLRGQAAQRRDKEREAGVMRRPSFDADKLSGEDRAILHEELQRLPKRFSSALVLCHLQGLTCEEAAQQLGCRPGTIKSRLARGRDALRTRLVRRGLAPSAAIAAAGASLPVSAAPTALVAPTARAAVLLLQGKALTGVLSAQVVAIANAVLHSMAANRITALLGTALLLGLVGIGVVFGRYGDDPPIPPADLARDAQEHDEAPPALPPPALPPPALPLTAVPVIQLDRGALLPAKLQPVRIGSRDFWQGGFPRSIAFSPDGKFLARSGGAPARVLDSRTGRNGFSIPKAEGHVAFAPDGRYLAIGGSGTVLLYRTSNLSPDPTAWQEVHALGRPNPNWKVLGQHPLKHAAGFVALAPDNRHVAFNDLDHSILVFDCETGAERLRLVGHEGEVWAGTFSPDGKFLATAGADRGIRLWDPATGREVRRLTGHEDTVRGLAFAKGGKTLASAGLDGAIALWDVDTGALVRQWKAHGDGVWAIAYSLDGDVLASASADRTVRLWDPLTGRERCRLIGYDGQAFTLAFSPGEPLLATGDGQIRFWNVRTGTEVIRGGRALKQMTAIAFSRDSRLLATTDGSAKVLVWDRITGAHRALVRHPHGDVTALAFAGEGNVLLAGSTSGAIAAFDFSRGVCRDGYREHRGPITALAVAPAGDVVVSADDHVAHLWDANTGQTRRRFDAGEDTTIRAAALAPDGKMLAVGAGDGMVRLWDLAKTDLAKSDAPRLLATPPGPAPALAFLSGGRLLTGTADVRLWDATTGRLLRIYRDALPPLAVNSDGTTLATADTRHHNIQLWDIASADLISSRAEHQGPVRLLEFAPDGMALASGGDDTTVTIWNDPDLPRRSRYSPKTLEALADDLFGPDPVKKGRAKSLLLAAAEQALPLMRRRLAPALDEQALMQLLIDLESGAAEVRQHARRRVNELRLYLEPGLQRLTVEATTPELRGQAKRLLEEARSGLSLQERILLGVPLHLLDALDVPQTNATIKELAAGPPGAWLTREAQTVLMRRKLFKQP
jgi:RNA polymerase sigma factor (sigma-70 family)